MKRISGLFLSAAAACLVLFSSCNLLNPTKSNDTTPDPTYTRAMDSGLRGYWDEIGPNRKVLQGAAAVKWHITNNVLSENGTRLLPMTADTAGSPLFSNNGKIGYVTVMYGDDVFSPAYDYTIKDTLGTTYLLATYTGTETSAPVEFSQVTGASWLITGVARGFKLGSATSNPVDTSTTPADTTDTSSTVDTTHGTGEGYASIISGSFYGWTGYDGANAALSFKFVQISGTDGSVTPVAGSDFFTSLVYRSDGRLYAISDELHIVDPATGTTTKIAALTYNDTAILMTAAAFTSSDVLYVADNNGTSAAGRRIFTVNLTTGALSLVGSAQYVGTSCLEFDSGDNLYGGANSLLKLDPTTAATIATVGSFASGVWMKQFRCISNETAIGVSGFTTLTLESINLSTAATTTLKTLAYGGVSAFTPAREMSAVAKRATAAALAKHGKAPQRSLAELIALENRYRSGQ